MRMFIFGLTLVASMSLGGLAQAKPVEISGAWARATVTGQTSSGAYMVIRSDHELVFVGVESSVAASVALHEMQMRGDMMSMRRVEKLAIHAGHPVVLDEHNYHIMLEGLKHTLKAGEHIVLRLKFVDTHGKEETVEVSTLVRDLSDDGQGR